jgi:mannose/fructose/N-acetylgalactosamine-specific phosphotransferase system component IIB
MNALNIGGIYAGPGRKRYLPYIYLTENEVEQIIKMNDYCTEVYFQDTPRSEVQGINLLQKGLRES